MAPVAARVVHTGGTGVEMATWAGRRLREAGFKSSALEKKIGPHTNPSQVF